MVIRWVFAAAISLAVAVLAGYTGALTAAGDSFAAFRVPFALALLFSALALAVLGRRLAAVPAATIAVVALSGPLIASLAPAAAVPLAPITIYQKNILKWAHNADVVADDIIATGADVVTLQEVTWRNRAVLDRLADTHPHQLHCGKWRPKSEAIASRFPMSERLCDEAHRLSGLRITTPHGPVWVLNLHLSWPWPFPQARQAEQAAATMEALEGPIILAGDFNMTPWSHVVTRLSEVTGTRRSGPVRPTYTLPLLGGVPIDHVLTPKDWQAQTTRRPRLWSDHKGLLTVTAPAGPR